MKLSEQILWDFNNVLDLWHKSHLLGNGRGFNIKMSQDYFYDMIRKIRRLEEAKQQLEASLVKAEDNESGEQE